MQLNEVLRRQDGVITAAQARGAGQSAAQVRHSVNSGRWLRLERGLFADTQRERTDRARLFEAALGAGSSSTVHGVAAAWWHGLHTQAPTTIGVTLPRGRRSTTRFAVVRRRDLNHSDRVELRGLWVTEVPLTVLEAAVELGPRGPVFLDRALQRRVTYPTARRAHYRNLGRFGSAAAAALLVAASDRAASQAERIMVRLLRSAGIDGWKLHLWSSGYELDFGFADERLAIEVDGWAWHRTPEQFQHDHDRQNVLTNQGWTVLRFTWHDLTVTPDAVIGTIRAALVAGRPDPGRSDTQ